MHGVMITISCPLSETATILGSYAFIQFLSTNNYLHFMMRYNEDVDTGSHYFKSSVLIT